MRIGLVLAALPLLLAGCGDDQPSDVNEKADGGGGTYSAPDCDDLDGQEIPEDFDGCMSSPDLLEAAISYDCDDGRTLVAAGPIMGFVGEPAAYIEDAGDSPQLQKLMSECRP